MVILTSSPDRASKPKRAASPVQEEDISQEELGRVIADWQEELRKLIEREATGRSAPEEKSKDYKLFKNLH